VADRSHIEWTEATWNPTVGCQKVSPGCKFCYAEVMHKRLRSMGKPKYVEAFTTVRSWEPHLDLPLGWQTPRVIFVNSMSDLFHDEVPFAYIERVFDVMVRARQHVFQVLTKRSARLVELAARLPWPENVWMGVSVEDQRNAYRSEDLAHVPARVRFLSVEPLLGPIPSLPLKGIHWVIVGGESGRNARPMDLGWVKGIQSLCLAQGVPFFLKQLGGRVDKRGGERARLDGRLWREFPDTSQASRFVQPGLSGSPNLSER
jgi:protein gp37